MTDTQFEQAFTKAKSLTLKPFMDFGEVGQAPGEITLLYDEDDFICASEMYGYLNHNLADTNKSIQIKQQAVDEVTLTLMIESQPPFIIIVPGLSCKKSNVDYFFQRQPADQPLLFKMQSILKGGMSTQKTIDAINAGNSANIHSPIQITSWKGMPLGTSSGEATNA